MLTTLENQRKWADQFICNTPQLLE